MVLPKEMNKFSKSSRSTREGKKPLKHLVIQKLFWAIHTDKSHADSGCTGYFQLCSILNRLPQHYYCPYEKKGQNSEAITNKQNLSKSYSGFYIGIQTGKDVEQRVTKLTLRHDLPHKDFSSDNDLILVLGQLQLRIDFQSCLIAFGPISHRFPERISNLSTQVSVLAYFRQE